MTTDDTFDRAEWQAQTDRQLADHVVETGVLEHHGRPQGQGLSGVKQAGIGRRGETEEIADIHKVEMVVEVGRRDHPFDLSKLFFKDGRAF